jgi:hypothetical protein
MKGAAGAFQFRQWMRTVFWFRVYQCHAQAMPSGTRFAIGATNGERAARFKMWGAAPTNLRQKHGSEFLVETSCRIVRVERVATLPLPISRRRTRVTPSVSFRRIGRVYPSSAANFVQHNNVRKSTVLATCCLILRSGGRAGLAWPQARAAIRGAVERGGCARLSQVRGLWRTTCRNEVSVVRYQRRTTTQSRLPRWRNRTARPRRGQFVTGCGAAAS